MQSDLKGKMKWHEYGCLCRRRLRESVHSLEWPPPLTPLPLVKTRAGSRSLTNLEGSTPEAGKKKEQKRDVA